MPDFSMYEGNDDVHHEGGELAIRQWRNQLVVINIPSRDLDKAMTRLEHANGHTCVRLTVGIESNKQTMSREGDPATGCKEGPR